MRYFVGVLFVVLTFSALAQPRQTVRGLVVENESQFPISGARIDLFVGDSSYYKTRADENGQFTFISIPVGKYVAQATMMTYNPNEKGVEVTSGREVMSKIELSESYLEKDEVKVEARKKGQVINECGVTISPTIQC